MTQTDGILKTFKLTGAGLAELLGHRNQTTVQYWKQTGKIPYWRHSEIYDAARKKRIPRAAIERLLAA